MPDLSYDPIWRDIHIVSVFACLALAILADLKASKILFRPLTSWDIRILEHYHLMLSIGLVVLWISGLFLIGAATGFDPAKFTPKLMAKIAVVIALTINAVLIGTHALRSLDTAPRQVLGDMTGRRRLTLCLMSAISFVSWASAYSLGAFPIFKPMSAEPLLFIFGHAFAIAVLGAAALAGFAGLALRSHRAHALADIEYDDEPLLLTEYQVDSNRAA